MPLPLVKDAVDIVQFEVAPGAHVSVALSPM